MLRLGVVGDVHGHWIPEDTAWFNASDLHALLFVGDLPSSRLHTDLLDVARALSGLTLPAILVPGNHDGPPPLAVLAEALGMWQDRRSHVRATSRAVRALEEALGPVILGGYSRHTVRGEGDVALDVVVGRPHGMDGRHLTFAAHLGERHGVRDLAGSTDRMYEQVRSCTNPILFLAHNGPAGLGSHAGAPWALRRLGRDNGDPDLRDVIHASRDAGHRVVGVVAGHQHHRGDRWRTEHQGLLHLNPARVPRVFRRGGAVVRHHLRLEFDGNRLTAREVLVGGG